MKERIILLLIFSVAIFFRFNNLNWDNNFHLHPDERFLTMVGTAQKIPNNILNYFNQEKSSLNPVNIGYQFFVYGTLPLTINKILAYLVDMDSYNGLTILGRFLSALADLMVVYFVYKIAVLLKSKFKLLDYFPIFSTFLYAIAVYPIQASHYFTTDTFLNTFLFISFYTSVVFYFEKKLRYFITSSFLFGLALSSKISAVYMFPLIGLITVVPLIKTKKILLIFLYCSLYFLVLYGTVRIGSPYYFESGDIFNLTINKQFLKNISELQYMSSGKMLFPPAVQWYSKIPVLFSLFNFSFVGLGFFFFLLSIMGGFFVNRIGILEIRKKKSKYKIDSLLGFAITIWIIGYFLYTSFQFSQSIRYLIFLFPFFSLFGGYALSLIQIKSRRLITGVIIVLFIWPLAFSSIYFFMNTRIQASWWIYKNIPNNSLILTEYWDDALPYPVSSNKQFRSEPLAVFDPDTKVKWDKMKIQLHNADYYILSSNRGWGSIPTVPDKYPIMGNFYNDLFNGKTNYMLIKRFIPFYQYFFPFHPNSWINNWLEETFTVYDHQSVFIYKNKK